MKSGIFYFLLICKLYHGKWLHHLYLPAYLLAGAEGLERRVLTSQLITEILFYN
jgi:hypothetical protein